MRRVLAIIAVGGLLLAACAEDTPTVGGETAGTGATGATAETGATGATAAATAADCAAANADAFQTAGTLTIGTGNPAFPPWWEGGEVEGSEFAFNEPSLGQGYEGAVAAEVAARLGFAFPDQVAFVPVAFNKSFAPGEKDFDFVLQQISYKPGRDDAVDFSESYYDVNQALVSAEGTSIAGATTIEELKDAKLGAPIGTTSLDVITEVVQPTQEPAVYDDLAQAVTDLDNGDIDGIVVDLPTAFFMAAVQIKKGVVVGQFGAESDEYFGMAFETGSPLVECVNLALQEMKGDGTLDAIEQQWLADKTNAPVLG
ncbi:MAG TPA: ABC transporter substrate-binding protein [Actinomycetota bacterium]|jgi:polar amino acid transport system substrate-binding protein|nr:ABC transporter substrate-binding protein [Actinomycetota bacterium]